MSKNDSLHRAKDAKQDEFYTQLTDIEKELYHYKDHFQDKVVFCNCDDPEYSNFWHFFAVRFNLYGLKKLIATHYEADKSSYMLSMERQDNETPTVIKHLKSNGDFRSPECVELLKEADIVVTNPPFSLFREYVAQLLEYGKQFLILGNQNCITYKEIFPLLKDNRMWLGYHCGDMTFSVPDYYEERSTRFWVDENGQKWRSMGNICWYTNMDIKKRHEDFKATSHYSLEEYPHYDNYDAIEVGKVANIPCDYIGMMGVPITFLQHHNPEQFEIVGMAKRGAGDPRLKTKVYTKEEYSNYSDLNAGPVLIKNGKPKNTYPRILIRRKV